MKTLPTVAASSRRDLGIDLLDFEGSDRIPNRDAVGFYYTVKRSPDEADSRLAVLFSGTVFYVTTEAFGLPPIEDTKARFTVFAEAAIGDYLDEHGLPDPTPSATPAARIECFSPHFETWRDRPPAQDAEIEQYISAHLFWSWRFGHDTWELGLSDCLRLRRSLKQIQRLVALDAGEHWTVTEGPTNSLVLTPLPAFLRTKRAAAQRPRPNQTSRQGGDVAESEHVVQTGPAAYVFVDELRIADLRKVTGGTHDLRKLIALCEELNQCYRSQCYHAVAALTRALLDHIPPLFGMATFAEVANNYAGTKSFRECMLHLEKAARTIADMHLHTRIRERESLPTRTQVNFSNELDVLLAEIARVIGTP